MKIPLWPTELHDMTGNSVEVISTSSATAAASPIILNQTEMCRTKFVPLLVNNEKEPQKSISGKLLYEKKRKSDASYPSEQKDTSDRVSRSSVKVGDWMEIRFDTSETYELFQGLKALYALYEEMGKIPFGSATFARVDSTFRDFLSIIQNDPDAAQMIGREENYDLVKTLLHLITQTPSLDTLKKSLVELQDENLQHLTVSLNIEKLRRVAKLMLENLDNDDEEFWQSTVFNENQWVLSQLFSSPCTIFDSKAYVGGKGIGNKGGNLCDFIYKNSLSQNVALIEIKTPCTAIVGNSYRGTWSFSHELSGAVNQVLNYKDTLAKDYYSLCHRSPEAFEVFTPKCVVIIGKLQGMNSSQIAAFENFRNSMSNVVIVTFDELYQRIDDLISVLEDDQSVTPCNESLPDVIADLPF